MISGSGHLACRVVDGNIRWLLVLNLGSNLVLGLGFRLYSTQDTTWHDIKQGAMHNQHDGSMLHFIAREEAHKKQHKTTSLNEAGIHI